MKQTYRKLTFLMATLALFNAAQARATPCDPCDLCCEPCNFSWLDDVTLSAQFVYWKPCFEGLDYALSVDDTSGGATLANEEFKYVDHNWKPGFQIAAALDDIYCGWGLGVNYLRIEGSNKSSTEVSTANGLIYSTLWLASDNTVYQSAESKHTFTYQVYNILFSRDCCFNDCHNFQPYFGVTGLILNQGISATYVDTSGSPNDNYTLRWSGDYVGTGLRLGTSYRYLFTNCLSFFFEGSTALVYGKSSPKARYLQRNDAGTVSLNQKLDGDSQCLFSPSVDIDVGFAYDTCWCGRNVGLLLEYNFVHWWKVATPARFVDSSANNRGISTRSSNGTLGFHGIKTGAYVSF